MPSYETLDIIADAYIPLLALLSIALIMTPLWQSRWWLTALRLLNFTLFAAIAYGIMFLDTWLNIWGAVGLDYSTHTAVASLLVVFLTSICSRLSPLWLSSLAAYLLLMRYQGYHTTHDIMTTVLALSVPAWAVATYSSHLSPLGKANNSSSQKFPAESN